MADRENPAWVVGLMSGTSLDGIDAALIETDGETVGAFGPSATFPYPAPFRARLAASLGRRSGHEAIEAELTRRHADAVRDLLSRLPAGHPLPDLVGFHGHTVDHRPDDGVTVQIGDGGVLARSLGVPVVNDFRGADVAAGGQGAPLAPLYHSALLAEAERPVAVLNLGGMANLTWIAKGAPPIAFDTGPGNALIDQWVERHTPAAPSTKTARWRRAGASRGMPSHATLADPFFDRPPRQIGRPARFRPRRRRGALRRGRRGDPGRGHRPAPWARAVSHLPEPPRRWYVTGGGRHNRSTMARLAARLDAPCDPVEALGWQGDALEAQAFAFLAMRSRRGLPLSLPTTTGVDGPVTGGVLHSP